ncbi:hypothetical protein HY498_02740 [Candidatus Woesearchaeota archaeon]|nr:hypothetical protein [Candidatus Woesearchaeota archaeon]
MVVRYFNLKVGKPDVNGSVLEVDMAKELERRVVCKTENKQPRLFGHRDGRTIYYFQIEEGLVKLALVDGELTIVDILRNEGVKVYFKELDEPTAKKMIEDCEYWTLLRGYVGPDLPAPSALDGKL